MLNRLMHLSRDNEGHACDSSYVPIAERERDITNGELWKAKYLSVPSTQSMLKFS